MRVAIVHDFLMQMGGAEKVVEVLHDIYPDAPIFTSAYDPRAMPAQYRQWDIRTSFLQRLLFKKYSHRAALLLYPTAFEAFDLSGYDLVISSSSAFAKGVITQPHTTHICYTHSPMRYAWATRSYVEKERIASPVRSLLAPGLHYLRTWDAIASTRVDRYIANSSAVARRIRKFYRREADVIHPPVNTDRFCIAPREDVGDYGIVASRLVPYKRVDLAVEAFTKLNRPLKVVGSGRQIKELQEKAGPTIEFLGYVSDRDLPALIARAKMYLMPGEEDFGIAPVEANACGVPVVAYEAGGALDVQIEGKTGCFFKHPSADSLCEAIERAYATDWDPDVIRANAMRFDTDTFIEKIKLVVATTEPGDRRGKKVNDRRQGVQGTPRQGDQRRVVLKQGRPLWFDRRRHILAADGVTVIGELVDPSEQTERIVELGAPFRPTTTINSVKEVYDDGPQSVIRVVNPRADSPQQIVSPLQQSLNGGHTNGHANGNGSANGNGASHNDFDSYSKDGSND